MSRLTKRYGYLLNWKGFNDAIGRIDDTNKAFFEGVARVPQLENITGRSGVKVPKMPKNWSVLLFRSSEPLGSETQTMTSLAHYEYFLHVRVSKRSSSVLIASDSYKVADSAIATFNTYVVPKLQRRYIRVADLAERMFRQKSQTDYYVTHFLADVPGYGEALKSMTLTGEDIASAGFFDMEESGENNGNGLPFSNFTARQIGLRPVDSRVECGRFGATGTVSFPPDAVDELDAFLNYANV